MIVIFGGTGTLGHALAKIIKNNGLEATIVSRCELRQKKMKQKFPKFKYIIGDITSPHDWSDRIAPPSTVYNLAAMKHVDTSEDNVDRCMDINYNGTVLTYEWAASKSAFNYVFSSTDKAVLPINAYGMAKGLSEKYLQERIEHSRRGMSPNISIFRWGNVMGSRGSVLHSFKESLLKENKITITDDRMTRFWIHIDDVAKFMYQKSNQVSEGKPHIPDMRAARVIDVGHAVASYLGVSGYDVEYTGIRKGEKIHEVLHTSHEYCINSENCEQFTANQLLDLVSRSLNENL